MTNVIDKDVQELCCLVNSLPGCQTHYSCAGRGLKWNPETKRWNKHHKAKSPKAYVVFSCDEIDVFHYLMTAFGFFVNDPHRNGMQVLAMIDDRRFYFKFLSSQISGITKWIKTNPYYRRS